MKRVVILGVSGSIGTQTLKVIKDNLDRFELVGVSVNTSIDFLTKVLKEFPSIKACCVGDKSDLENLKCTKKFYGLSGLDSLASMPDADLIVNGLSGFIGLAPTLAAINADKDIAIANKEALVCGGDLIDEALKRHPVKLIPIDSEHSAISQCLKGEDIKSVRNLIITASGGPFRDKSLDELKSVSIKDALNHPTWKMGSKITIDSATLVNKGLEVIEAHYLFKLPYEKIKTVIHYESVVHSMVEFIDGSIKAQMGRPSMEIPILYALNYEKHSLKSDCNFSFDKAIDLHFRPLDEDRFKAVPLAYKVGKMGGIMPAVYSIANEEAVRAFLNGVIRFDMIVDVIERVVNETSNVKHFTFNELTSIVSDVRRKTQELCEKMKEV